MYVIDYIYAANSNNWTKNGCKEGTEKEQKCWYWHKISNESNPKGVYDGGYPELDYRTSVGYDWLYMGLTEWTITQGQEGTAPVVTASQIVAAGNYLGGTVGAVSGAGAVRPVFYLDSNVKYISGAGTLDNPYRIG